MPRVYAEEVRHEVELFLTTTLDSGWSFAANKNRSYTTLFSSQQRRKQGQVSLFSKWISIFLLFVTLPTQLTYAFPGNDTKNACWYFVTSNSDIGSFSLVPVMASESQQCLDISYINYWKPNYHEPRIIPRAKGITIVAFYPESIPACHLYFRRKGGN